MQSLPQVVTDRIVDWGNRAHSAWDVITATARTIFEKGSQIASACWDWISASFDKAHHFVEANHVPIEVALAVLFVALVAYLAYTKPWK